MNDPLIIDLVSSYVIVFIGALVALFLEWSRKGYLEGEDILGGIIIFMISPLSLFLYLFYLPIHWAKQLRGKKLFVRKVK